MAEKALRGMHIELFEPTSPQEWDDFAKAVAAQINRLKFNEKENTTATQFLSQFLDQATVDLTSEELQKVSIATQEMTNECLKALRDQQGKKKKKQSNRAQLNVDGDDDDDDYGDYEPEVAGPKKVQPVLDVPTDALAEALAEMDASDGGIVAAHNEAQQGPVDYLEGLKRAKPKGKKGAVATAAAPAAAKKPEPKATAGAAQPAVDQQELLRKLQEQMAAKFGGGNS
eukprot:TRINITY_DN80208_c0_g1_i1.p3 TRINITY_DN80208_c0_g1~~TRINITY_DN80208_c0_g1_i1.p3  ORF type:complete len:246 (-),score=83.26 TRINITY_DN80208_c0_g1_i1:49-732(-)